MKYCLFIVSIPHLHSYEILSDVTVLYESYLKLRGHSVVISDQPRPDCRNIMFGVNVAPPNLVLPQDTIIVDLEQASINHPNGAPTAYRDYLNYLRQYHVWTYSRHNLELLKQRGIHRARWVPIGSAPVKIPELPLKSPEIDVLFMGHLWPRRDRIKNELIQQARIPNVVFTSSAWGPEREELIARAKIILNIGSFDSVHQFEIVRILPLLQRKKFVISETADNITEYQYLSSGIVICPYTEIVAKVKEYLHPNKAAERTRISQFGYDAIQQHRLQLPLLDFDSTALTKLYQAAVARVVMSDLSNYFLNVTTVYCRSSQTHLPILAAYYLFRRPTIQNVVFYTSFIPPSLQPLIVDLGFTIQTTPPHQVDLLITDGSTWHDDDLNNVKTQILLFSPQRTIKVSTGWHQQSIPSVSAGVSLTRKSSH